MADQVRVYAMLNPAQLIAERQTIQQIVFRLLRITDAAAHSFTISESSGWISYVALEELWTRRYPPVLASREEARTRAESFLAALTAATSPGAEGWPNGLEQVSLLPRLIRPLQLSAVPRPGGGAYDHWLYRAQPRLSLDVRQSAGVFGSQIEVRIGHRGQIISFRSRWRPTSGERVNVDLVPFKEPPSGQGDDHASSEGHGGEHHGEGGDDHDHDGVHLPDRAGRKQPLFYLLEGEAVPQHYLAPYYFASDGHMLRMVTACEYSLTIEFGRSQGAESMLVWALANGGTGDYAYNWAAYTLERVEDGYTALGRGQSVQVETNSGPAMAGAIELPNGAYIVMVNVRDRQSGAFKHAQHQVVSTLFVEQPRQRPEEVPVA